MKRPEYNLGDILAFWICAVVIVSYAVVQFLAK